MSHESTCWESTLCLKKFSLQLSKYLVYLFLEARYKPKEQVVTNQLSISTVGPIALTTPWFCPGWRLLQQMVLHNWQGMMIMTANAREHQYLDWSSSIQISSSRLKPWPLITKTKLHEASSMAVFNEPIWALQVAFEASIHIWFCHGGSRCSWFSIHIILALQNQSCHLAIIRLSVWISLIHLPESHSCIYESLQQAEQSDIGEAYLFTNQLARRASDIFACFNQVIDNT